MNKSDIENFIYQECKKLEKYEIDSCINAIQEFQKITEYKFNTNILDRFNFTSYVSMFNHKNRNNDDRKYTDSPPPVLEDYIIKEMKEDSKIILFKNNISLLEYNNQIIEIEYFMDDIYYNQSRSIIITSLEHTHNYNFPLVKELNNLVELIISKLNIKLYLSREIKLYLRRFINNEWSLEKIIMSEYTSANKYINFEDVCELPEWSMYNYKYQDKRQMAKFELEEIIVRELFQKAFYNEIILKYLVEGFLKYQSIQEFNFNTVHIHHFFKTIYSDNFGYKRTFLNELLIPENLDNNKNLDIAINNIHKIWTTLVDNIHDIEIKEIK